MDVSGAVPVTVRAGGIILHHTRMLHASAPNSSSHPRRLLLQLAVVDAWPVMGTPDLAQFGRWVLRGQPTSRYRVKEMDIRIPLPKHDRQGSIYEIQTLFVRSGSPRCGRSRGAPSWERGPSANRG